jgi:tetratricopeptide (TPR) repeat protein
MPLYPWAASTGLARDSTALSLHNTLAAAYAGEGRYALAIQTLVRALRQRPEFALGHANLGGMYFKLGQYQQAEPHLRQASRPHSAGRFGPAGLPAASAGAQGKLRIAMEDLLGRIE